MTENSVENAAAENAAEEPTVQEPTTVEEPAEKPDRGNREAAKYRTRLRETEAERDTLRTSLEQARQQLLTARLDPMLMKLVTLTGTTTDRIFTDEGTLDEDALEKLATELDEQHPGILQRRTGWQLYGEPTKMQIFRDEGKGAAAPFDPDEGKSPANHGPGKGWVDAFTANTP